MSAIRTVGGVALPYPIMIGAGACKTPKETAKWLTVAPVVSGSYTPEARAGNEGILSFPDDFDGLMTEGYGLNAFGMPNPGFAGARAGLEVCDNTDQLIVSVAGFSIGDYLAGIEAFMDLPYVQAIELNFGCPNVAGKQIGSFDLAVLRSIFQILVAPAKPIWVKLSPYSDPYQLEQVAHLVLRHQRAIKAVVACNTFPNAYDPESGITANNGFAGLSGPAMKAIALGQVRQFAERLGSAVDVIGVGGITTGNDIIDFFDAGARGVQLTSTPFWLGDPGKFWDHLLNRTPSDRLKRYIDALEENEE